MTEAIDHLRDSLSRNALVTVLLDRWEDIDLPDCWLVAGAIAQTVWNVAHARAPEANIKDIDLVYFDAEDLSAEAERAREVRIRNTFGDLGAAIDVKNEARVHLWYEAKFGYPLTPYLSVEEAIATFPTTATSIGVRPRGPGIEVCAPFGLTDLMNLVVRPNKAQIRRAVYEAKIARWRQHWPRLTVIGWDEA